MAALDDKVVGRIRSELHETAQRLLDIEGLLGDDTSSRPSSLDLPSPENMTVAERVRFARGVRGLTQQELADLSSVAISAIRKVEGGKVEPRPTTLGKLAQALDIPARWMMGEP